jgi:hypothetical protein
MKLSLTSAPSTWTEARARSSTEWTMPPIVERAAIPIPKLTTISSGRPGLRAGFLPGNGIIHHGTDQGLILNDPQAKAPQVPE